MRAVQLILVLLIPGVGQAASKTTIAVRVTSDVTGPAFTLGEVADITSPDRALGDRLRALPMGTSPLPGLSRTLYLTDLFARLRLNHIDPSQMALSVPAGVKITRRGAEVPVTGITDAAVVSVKAALGADADGAVIEPVTPPARLVAEPGKLEFQAGAPQGRLQGGTVTVPVTVTVDGKPSRQVSVTLRIRRAVTALVAKRTLPAHTVLTADDVTVTQLENPAGQTPLTDLASVVGKRTARQVQMGEPLTESAVQSTPVVDYGAKVTVEVSVGGVRICAPALARSQGAVGERIPVFTLDTKKMLMGVVVDATTVRVEEE